MKSKNDKRMKLYGIILAGGESSRMGSPKVLLEIDEKTFAGIAAEKLLKAGVSSLYMVLGARSDEMKNGLNRENLNIIINPLWQQGQLSSLKAAVRKIPGDAEGAVVSLIDHPLVKVKTIKKLVEVFGTERPHGVVPVYRGRGGHPVIFSKKVFKALLRAPLNEGARAVVKNKDFNFLRVEVDDLYLRQDIDTPGEYRREIGK